MAAVAVIAGVAFFLIKKNKKKDNEGSDELRPIDPNAPVTNTEEVEVPETTETVSEVIVEEEVTEPVVEATDENDDKKEDSTEN